MSTKTVTLHVAESVIYKQTFTVPAAFDTEDEEAVTELWTTQGNFTDCTVTDRWITAR